MSQVTVESMSSFLRKNKAIFSEVVIRSSFVLHWPLCCIIFGCFFFFLFLMNRCSEISKSESCDFTTPLKNLGSVEKLQENLLFSNCYPTFLSLRWQLWPYNNVSRHYWTGGLVCLYTYVHVCEQVCETVCTSNSTIKHQPGISNLT